MATLPYIGNNDFRGYLTYLGHNGDSQAANALNYTGNDGGVNNGSLLQYVQSAGNSSEDAGLQQAARDYVSNAYSSWQRGQGNVLSDNTGGGTGGVVAAKPAPDLSLFNNNEANLNDLLGRTQKNLDQGLVQNQDQYDTQVGQTNTDKAKQVQDQNTAKQSAYDRINQNAGTGYRSLAQIIGRSAGTGSSAYQQLLPDVIGKDTSSKRLDTTNTFGKNLSNIDTSFESVLADLLKQKKQNEDTLKSGIEGQRQNINSQLAQNAIARSQAAGKTPGEAVAAAQPFQSAIQSSRDQVQNFFDQFRTPYTPQTPNLNLAQYQTDPTTVSAGQQGFDPTNPYSAILRKKLQGSV